MTPKQAAIVKVYAKHYPHNQYRGRKPEAYMTLWAETTLDHRVWLATKRGLTTASIDSKVKLYEEANQLLVGREIQYDFNSYKEIGFLRSLEDSLWPVDPWR